MGFAVLANECIDSVLMWFLGTSESRLFLIEYIFECSHTVSYSLVVNQTKFF